MAKFAIFLSPFVIDSSAESWQVTNDDGPFISTDDHRVGKKSTLLLPISPFTVAASSRSFLMLSNPSLVELSTAREDPLIPVTVKLFNKMKYCHVNGSPEYFQFLCFY